MSSKISNAKDENTPKTLYHYCPLEKFKKIIESKTLRFGDITKSNDYLELFYLYKLYHKYHSKNSNKSFDFGTFLAEQNIKNEKTYCFCLSELKDDLSQWRGYAPNGGVAIGFDYTKLSKFTESIKTNLGKNGTLEKITYISDDQNSEDYYEKHLSKWFDEINKRFNDDLKNDLPTELETTELSKCDYKFKNDGFKCEKEWRIAFRYHNEMEPKQLNVSQQDVPLKDDAFYIPFHLSMISEIIIGPKVEFLGQREGFREMLYKFLKENDNEYSEDDKYRLKIEKEDVKLTKLSYT